MPGSAPCPSTTLSDPIIRSKAWARSKYLYFFSTSATLQRGERSPRDFSVATTNDLARSVQGMLRSSRASARPSTVRSRAAQRQRAQVDGSNAGARDRAWFLSSVPAFHHRCTVGYRLCLATTARLDSRTQGPPDLRWHQLSQTRHPVGGSGASVLWGVGKNRQLPGGGDGGAVEREARVHAWRGPVPPRR